MEEGWEGGPCTPLSVTIAPLYTLKILLLVPSRFLRVETTLRLYRSVVCVDSASPLGKFITARQDVDEDLDELDILGQDDDGDADNACLDGRGRPSKKKAKSRVGGRGDGNVASSRYWDTCKATDKDNSSQSTVPSTPNHATVSKITTEY